MVTIFQQAAAARNARPAAAVQATGRNPGEGLCLTNDLRRRGRVLLHQQLWLFGQDIRRPEGNALLERGFTRRRPSAGEIGGNAYTLRLDAGRSIVLWGFGVYHADPRLGGVFLPRFTFTPRLARSVEVPEGAWHPSQLPESRLPRTRGQWACARRLLIPALRWLAGYERWVLAARGPEYRRCCVAAWPKATIPAERVADEWADLAERCDAQLGAALLV